MSEAESELVEDVSPPWGTLVAEAYILHHWTSLSRESSNDQRKSLVNEFIKAGAERNIPKANPSAAEVSSILEPWRTMDQREIALCQPGSAIWLRTCYAEGSDEKHETLIEHVDMEIAVDGEDRLLDDSELYNYGVHWQNIFDVLPELLGPNDAEYWTWSLDNQRKEVEALRAYAEQGIPAVDAQLVSNLSYFEGEELEHEMAKVLQSGVHAACVVNWLVVEDEEALETGDVLMIFIDSQGRVVRSTRVSPGAAAEMGGFWQRCSWYEIDEWVEGEFGPEYQLGGSCEGLLLEKLRQTLKAS